MMPFVTPHSDLVLFGVHRGMLLGSALSALFISAIESLASAVRKAECPSAHGESVEPQVPLPVQPH